LIRALCYTVGQLAALACLTWGIYLLAGLGWALAIGGGVLFFYLVLLEGIPAARVAAANMSIEDGA
jgi:hypothetical protein